MFSFTKRADYALLALGYLASHGADERTRLVNSKEIAEHYRIPVELLAKIMQILARRKLVASLSGPTGGYRLLRSPESISVAEVVDIIDGPMSIIHCTSAANVACEQWGACIIRGPLSFIEDRMRGLLEGITVATIAKETASFHPESLMTSPQVSPHLADHDRDDDLIPLLVR
jgi:Rrf2 family protein